MTQVLVINFCDLIPFQGERASFSRPVIWPVSVICAMDSRRLRFALRSAAWPGANEVTPAHCFALWASGTPSCCLGPAAARERGALCRQWTALCQGPNGDRLSVLSRQSHKPTLFSGKSNRTKVFHVKHFGTIGPKNFVWPQTTAPSWLG